MLSTRTAQLSPPVEAKEQSLESKEGDSSQVAHTLVGLLKQKIQINVQMTDEKLQFSHNVIQSAESLILKLKKCQNDDEARYVFIIELIESFIFESSFIFSYPLLGPKTQFLIDIKRDFNKSQEQRLFGDKSKRGKNPVARLLNSVYEYYYKLAQFDPDNYYKSEISLHDTFKKIIYHILLLSMQTLCDNLPLLTNLSQREKHQRQQQIFNTATKAISYLSVAATEYWNLYINKIKHHHFLLLSIYRKDNNVLTNELFKRFIKDTELKHAVHDFYEQIKQHSISVTDREPLLENTVMKNRRLFAHMQCRLTQQNRQIDSPFFFPTNDIDTVLPFNMIPTEPPANLTNSTSKIILKKVKPTLTVETPHQKEKSDSEAKLSELMNSRAICTTELEECASKEKLLKKQLEEIKKQIDACKIRSDRIDTDIDSINKTQIEINTKLTQCNQLEKAAETQLSDAINGKIVDSFLNIKQSILCRENKESVSPTGMDAANTTTDKLITLSFKPLSIPKIASLPSDFKLSLDQKEAFQENRQQFKDDLELVCVKVSDGFNFYDINEFSEKNLIRYKTKKYLRDPATNERVQMNDVCIITMGAIKNHLVTTQKATSSKKELDSKYSSQTLHSLFPKIESSSTKQKDPDTNQHAQPDKSHTSKSNKRN